MVATIRTAAIFALVALCSAINLQTCPEIEQAFRNVALENDTSVCNCAYDGSYAEVNGASVGCSSSTASNIFVALQALNDTKLGLLTIRDSLVNVLPSNIFENVKPQQLAIERCALALIRTNTIGSIGANLERLSLRDNKLKIIESEMFIGLTGLKTLDLSNNKITKVEKEAFIHCGQLEELVLNNNDISDFEIGTFDKLKNLKVLSLIGNKISKIDKNMFNGLEKLEVLQLQDNNIEKIEWNAFKKMKSLKTLNIGNNHISMVEVRGLEHLEKILLNNNSIENLLNVKLRDLPALNLLTLDRNRITSIGNKDLGGLARSPCFESLSLASNNISEIGSDAFTHVPNLQMLSLQNNYIANLSSKGIPIFHPLKELTILQLSANQLTALNQDELPKSLIHLALDHNQINHISPGVLDEISFKRLYLNNNRIPFLNRGAFSSIDMAAIEAVDVSSNVWQCDCSSDKEWLPAWLVAAEESDVSEGPIGCLAIPGCGTDHSGYYPDEEDKKSKWMTVVATMLALLSFFILMAIVYLYLKDMPPMLTRSKRADSDLHKLIDNDPLNTLSDSLLVLPHPIFKKIPTNGVGNGVEKKVRFEEK